MSTAGIRVGGRRESWEDNSHNCFSSEKLTYRKGVLLILRTDEDAGANKRNYSYPTAEQRRISHQDSNSSDNDWNHRSSSSIDRRRSSVVHTTTTSTPTNSRSPTADTWANFNKPCWSTRNGRMSDQGRESPGRRRDESLTAGLGCGSNIATTATTTTAHTTAANTFAHNANAPTACSGPGTDASAYQTGNANNTIVPVVVLVSRRVGNVDASKSGTTSRSRSSSSSRRSSQTIIKSFERQHELQHDQSVPARGQVTSSESSAPFSPIPKNHHQQQQRRQGEQHCLTATTTTSSNDYFHNNNSQAVLGTRARPGPGGTVEPGMANPTQQPASKQHSTGYTSTGQPQSSSRRDTTSGMPNHNAGSRQPKEFVPSFVLVDACKANNERKIRELVRRLTPFSSEDVDPIVNFQDSCGRTALSYACSSGNVMIIDELSKLRRLDPNRGDNENNTPLHYAAQAGHSETVDLLLSRFEGVIDPNCRNSTGLTPLMKAALQGRTRCAKSLISAGAQANLRDYSRGLTAAEWARLCGRHICAEVIIRCAKDNYQNPNSPPSSTFPRHRALPVSQSALELKKLDSEETPYYQLYTSRSSISGASWLKNKIKKALGASSSNLTHHSSNNNFEDGNGGRRDSFALLSNLTGPTICAGSLLLPSIKPLIDQQKPRLSRKLTIPVLQITPVKR